jgi:hypothetical protein
MMHAGDCWRCSCRHALKKVHSRRKNDEVLYCGGFMPGEGHQNHENNKRKGD